MVGITRFKIKGEYTTPGGQRFIDAMKYWDRANNLYRQIFACVKMPLFDGEEIIECTREEFEAGYDYQLGIDLILRPIGYCESTLQEKFLFTSFNTLTIEHCNDWLTLTPGDWYKLKANYYFVGYDKEQICGTLYPWILVNWQELVHQTALGHIAWKLRGNDVAKVGARASFMYVPFNKVPNKAVLLSSEQSKLC